MNTRVLARSLGLSHTAVSLALKNHPRISEETKRRVREAAEKAGYRPNALVSALMARIKQGKSTPSRGEVLAFLTAFEERDTWRKLTTNVEGLAGARTRAELMGYRIEHFWLGPDADRAPQVSRVLRMRGVRGAFILALPASVSVPALDWDRFPVVAVGYSLRGLRVHQACDHHVEGAITCYRELRAAGRRRIGLAITRFDDEQVRHYWRAGFLAAQQIHGGDVVPIHFHPGYHEDGGFIDWVRRSRLDALIGSFPNLGLNLLRGAGVSVPGKVAYASLDLDRGQLGQIAGIRQDWEQTGAAIIDLLVGQINANERGLPRAPKLVQIAGQWVPGKTVAG